MLIKYPLLFQWKFCRQSIKLPLLLQHPKTFQPTTIDAINVIHFLTLLPFQNWGKFTGNSTSCHLIYGSFRVESTRNFAWILTKLGTYGAHHPYQLLTTYITEFLIYGHEYFEYFMKKSVHFELQIYHLCYYFKIKISVIENCW